MSKQKVKETPEGVSEAVTPEIEVPSGMSDFLSSFGTSVMAALNNVGNQTSQIIEDNKVAAGQVTADKANQALVHAVVVWVVRYIPKESSIGKFLHSKMGDIMLHTVVSYGLGVAYNLMQEYHPKFRELAQSSQRQNFNRIISVALASDELAAAGNTMAAFFGATGHKE